MSIITLTTDFGEGSPYVAEMKGVILGVNPLANVIDVTHSVSAQAVSEASFILSQSISSFPAGTIHVIVVDPGVGTDRKLVCAKIGDWSFVCPDNGILTLTAEKYPLHAIRELDSPQFWRDNISNTFHGRDVMAPVAGHLSKDIDFESLGSEVDDWIRLEFPIPQFRDNELHGQIIWIDSFGNLVSNIDEEALTDFDYSSMRVSTGFHSTVGLARTFAERGERQLVAYLGSGGKLEIATVNENAKEKLAARIGDAVVVMKK